jgi:hypothetical protein
LAETLGGLPEEEQKAARERLVAEVAARFGTTPEAVERGLEEAAGRLAATAEAAPDPERLLERIETLPRGQVPSREELRPLLDGIAGQDEITRARLIQALARRTGLSRTDIRRWVEDARRAMEARAAAAEAAEAAEDPGRGLDEQGRKLVRAAFPDAPCPDGLVLPRGYYTNSAGQIFRVGMGSRGEEMTHEVSPCPLIISRRLRDEDTGEVKVELAFRRTPAAGWSTVVTDRQTMQDSKLIPKLAREADLVASSDLAKELARYLPAFEQENYDRLPLVRSVSALGWRGGPPSADPVFFVWGREVIVATGAAPPRVVVDPPGPGEAQLLDAMRAGGSWEGWLDAFRIAFGHPVAATAVYAGLASPLFPILGLSGVVIHLCNLTSRGKTTAAQLSASSWGYPGGVGLPGTARLLMGWVSTRVGREQTCAFLRHLPAYFDGLEAAVLDEKRAGKEIAEIAYMIADGVGKLRGAPKGSRHTATWQLLAVSTGEVPLHAACKRGGLQVRAVDIWAAPFADARSAEEIRALVGSHYGWAGPRFVQAVAAMSWAELKAQHAELAERLRAAAGGRRGVDDLSGRYIAPFAAIVLAAEIFHREAGRGTWLAEVSDEELFGLVADVLADALKHESPRHEHEKAYDDVMTWAAANQAGFWGGDPAAARPPQSGWHGVWSWRIRRLGEDCIAFTPRALEEALGGKYNLEAVAKAWRDAGILVPPPEDREHSGDNLKRTVKIGDTWARAYVLRRRPPGGAGRAEEEEAEEADRGAGAEGEDLNF